jgi:hypothetical protein
VLKFVPEAGSDDKTRAVNRAILAKSVEFWKADAGQLGRSSSAEWAASQQIMRRMGLIDSEGEVENMFTNRFIMDAKQ